MNPKNAAFRFLAPAIATWLIISFLAALAATIRTALYFHAPLYLVIRETPSSLARFGWLMGLLLAPAFVISSVLLQLPVGRPLWDRPRWSWLVGAVSAPPAIWMWYQILNQTRIIEGDFFASASFEAVFTFTLAIVGGSAFSSLHSYLIRRSNCSAASPGVE